MKKNKYNVELSRRAENMLLQHAEFLARVSLTAARRLIESVKVVEAKLSNNPEIYPYADEIDAFGIPHKTYRKCIFEKRYKALFLIEGSNVYVDAIIDTRQENKNLY
jgi:plasmid stabilization system protein ParE